ncbi:TonB-dependent receptor domain-containing protein [Abyssalbus ytuae]|uniref:TonB-dependent receptor n=1 Tax=Abyssalbus ytuae TaxID=2926907 RepID=A0A9E6ZMD8_9FLAO|nr:TonB-dependent receptor [Abyssalbus ytuae]UOB16970.1 TonB-dependent receptor [Abyssalbus ytuae]
MKHFITLCALLFTSLFYAQTAPNVPVRGTVTGKVIDNALKQPVPYASIIIKSKAEGTTITGGITDDAGSFEIKDVPEGSHIFEIQFIGYITFSKEITISSGNRKIDLGTITLEENVQELEGVDVVAERTTIEQRIDRKVINVGKDLTTAGATASDIMNNIPSVSVDQQTGAISLRGNENVRVMVDGKLSNVPVDQLLKQIPSSSIKSIELITNPSAKYNPEGMSGIINIVLHKNVNIGFNGNVNMGLSYEEEAKFNSSIDLNYRRGKFNLYGNYGNNISKNINYGYVEREDDPSTDSFNENQVQNFDFKNNNKSHLYKVGVDFYLNEKNTLSFFTNQNLYDGKGYGLTKITAYDPAVANSSQLFNNENSNHSQQYNFDYKLDFAKEGHNIELELDYNKFEDEEDAFFNFNGFSLIPDYNDYVDTNRDQFIGNLDYVNPLSEKSKLELGVETRLFETDIDYSSTGLSYNEEGELRPTPDTFYTYTMDIYSGYATFGQNFEKWSYQLGARIENVEVNADTSNVKIFTDKYTQIYPSVFVTYNQNEKNQFQFSFSRRVDRPGLQQVNPIREWSTPQISSFGNPSLVPQFTNSYEVNYTRRLEKGSVTMGVFFRSIEDEINRALYVDRTDLSKQILTFDNFENTSAYGIEVSSNYRPTNWWSINGSFDFYTSTQKGLTESLSADPLNATENDIVIEKVEVDNVAWNLRMNNNFKVNKNLSFSLFGFYRGKNKGIQLTAKPMYFVNAGLRQSFAQGKGTFSFNFNDVFNTMKFRFTGENPYRQFGEFNWESRTVYVGLSYRFGSGKDRALSRKRRDDNTKQGGGGIL